MGGLAAIDHFKRVLISYTIANAIVAESKEQAVA
jgi:hypothetical protein